MSIDTQIRDMFDKLAARKAKVDTLKASVAKSWKTTGTFRQFGQQATTNLQTATADIIAEVATQIELLSAASAIAYKKLDLGEPGNIQGYSVDAWYADLNKRMATINLRTEEQALATLETRLNSVLSPEERRRIEVELLLKEF